MIPDRDPLEQARAMRARADYMLWDTALGLLALAVGLAIIVLAAAA